MLKSTSKILIIVLISSINSLRGNTSLATVLNVMYSDSVVNMAISVYNLLKYIMGYLAYSIIHPILDLIELGPSQVSFEYVPAKSASTYHSNWLMLLLSLNLMTFFLVPNMYFLILLIASPCGVLGLHWS